MVVDTPLEIAEQRDPKGRYATARTGQIANFTRIDSPYERLQAPEVRLDTEGMSVEACVDALLAIVPRRARREAVCRPSP